MAGVNMLTVEDIGFRALQDSVFGDDCYFFCAPMGPNTPFEWPGIIWFDIIRIIIMVAGLVVVVSMPRLVLSSSSKGQRFRLFGQGFFALIVIGTEVDHIGDAAHYRLFISGVGIACTLYGNWQLHKEIPPHRRPEHRNLE
jgi:hypothetical protein